MREGLETSLLHKDHGMSVRFVEHVYQVQSEEGNIGEIIFNQENKEYRFHPYVANIDPSDMQRIIDRTNKLNGK
jgi:hypothetical protein